MASVADDVAPGGSGEVVYRSPQLCEGYWDKPEETAEAFRDGWFHSGDLVRIDEQGYITVVDRIKDVINTGGAADASETLTAGSAFDLPTRSTLVLREHHEPEVEPDLSVAASVAALAGRE